MVQRTSISLNIGRTIIKISEKGTNPTTQCTSLRAITQTLPLESISQTQQGLRYNLDIGHEVFNWKHGFISMVKIAIAKVMLDRTKCRRTTCLRGDTFQRLLDRKKIATFANCAGWEVQYVSWSPMSYVQGEHWYGRLGPCSPLRLPLAGTKLG